MKWMMGVCLSVTFFSASVLAAGSGTGGAPAVPCYVDGKYIGTIDIIQCQKQGQTTQS